MDEQFKQHGAFSWCELMTTDADAAKAFYTKLFGWDTEDMSMPGMTYTVVKAGGKGIGGIMSIPKEAQGMPPKWGPYVTVDDVDHGADCGTTWRQVMHAAPRHSWCRAILCDSRPTRCRNLCNYLQNIAVAQARMRMGNHIHGTQRNKPGSNNKVVPADRR